MAKKKKSQARKNFDPLTSDFAEWPTESEIMSSRTPRGGWRRDKLAQWGIPWPPPPGWKAALIALDRSFFRNLKDMQQARAEERDRLKHFRTI